MINCYDCNQLLMVYHVTLILITFLIDINLSTVTVLYLPDKYIMQCIPFINLSSCLSHVIEHIDSVFRNNLNLIISNNYFICESYTVKKQLETLFYVLLREKCHSRQYNYVVISDTFHYFFFNLFL